MRYLPRLAALTAGVLVAAVLAGQAADAKAKPPGPRPSPTPSPTAMPSPTPTSTPSAGPTPSASPTPTVTPTGVPASPFLPFGPKQLPNDAYGNPYTGGYVNAGQTVADLAARVQAAQHAHARIIVKLPQATSYFTNPDGTFNLELWKKHVDRLRGFDFAAYVADGTVLGAELVNEPNDRSNWGGTPLTKAEFDGAGAYAKSIWPTLPVGGGRSDWILANAPWLHIDFGHSQYHMRKGDIGAWISRTVQESRQAGVALLMSLNFLAGQLDNSPMTAAQLSYYYSAMVRETYSCALTGYLYDAAYLAQPDVAAVMAKINDVAKTHPAPPCFVGSRVMP